jgi:hypothetical protein
MGAAIAESLSAPCDVFLPVRVLDILSRHFHFSSASVFLRDPQTNQRILFAGIPSPVPGDAGPENFFSLGTAYTLAVPASEAAEKTFSLLDSSLGSKMDSSRPSPFSHSGPQTLPAAAIAQNAARRHRDSQSKYATLCFLDIGPYLSRLHSAFPRMNKSCLEKDILRVLASFFEPAGGFYRSEEGHAVALACSSAPMDTELLQIQLCKALQRFVTFAVPPEIVFRDSRSFDSPHVKPMEDFLMGCGIGNRGMKGPAA